MINKAKWIYLYETEWFWLKNKNWGTTILKPILLSNTQRWSLEVEFSFNSLSKVRGIQTEKYLIKVISILNLINEFLFLSVAHTVSNLVIGFRKRE